MSNNSTELLQDAANLFQDATIHYMYNSFLMNILLLGIYTSIYFETLYIYLSSKASRSFVVMSAITALYLLNVEQAAIQWFWINGFFGMAGRTRSVAYDYTNVGPIWSYLVTNINGSLLATIADSLLVRIFAL
ncbi:hypothetical protein HYPSUDRAFT_206202 [Hypholoma sublateritium FD-334 SS-4]|uniref:Uncharacterized protein n=1 Tax=Hypholoma sublateritium (strain FD-334 SS-4) TaxID=945553 RepID=A0A0D2PAL5_HYPSF|nr:hypothetical protein HYPSUDRAFT_206202 [Hypholoma sublateritium FD-334 SS-4]